MVVIDEAHHARAKHVGSRSGICPVGPTSKRIGLTATPERLDGKGIGRSTVAEMVMGPTISELVAVGSLAPSPHVEDTHVIEFGGDKA